MIVPVFTTVAPTRYAAPESLKHFPELSKMVVEMLNHPHIPRAVKGVLKLLYHPRLRIVKITPNVEKSCQLDPKVAAAFVNLNDMYFIKFTPLNRGGAFHLGQPQRTKINSNVVRTIATGNSLMIPVNYVILLRNRPITFEHNDLLNLIHELAHFRFDLLLADQLEDLIGYVPETLVKCTEEGKLAIHTEFHALLTERFARMVEYTALLAANDQSIGFDTWYKNYPKLDEIDDATSMRRYIADKVVRLYDITDPQALEYRYIPLGKLFDLDS